MVASDMTQEIGRNDPCPCGSGKKYKKCCGRPGMAKHHTEVITPSSNSSLLDRIGAIGSAFQKTETKSLKDMTFQVGPIGETKENIPPDDKKD